MGLLYKTTVTVTSVIVTSVDYAREDIVTFHCVLFSTIPGVISVWINHGCVSPGQWCVYAFISQRFNSE